MLRGEGVAEGQAPRAGAAPGRRSLTGRLFSESAIYGLGGVAAQALAIVLVPLYANVLGTSNYGVLALVNTTLSLGTMIVTLALPQAFFWSYMKGSDSPSDRSAVLRTTLGVRLAASLAGSGAAALLAAPISQAVFGRLDELPILLLVAAIVFFDTLNSVPLSYLRAERRPLPYATVAFGRAGLGSALAVVFVVALDMGVLGVVVGSFVAATTATVAGFAILARSGMLRIGWDTALARRMLAFGVPLVPASIAGWALNLSDRYVVQAFDGQSAVGVYAAGYTIGLVLNALAIAPFALAWGGAFWEIAKGEAAGRTFARVMTGFLVFASFMALTVSALSTDALRLLFRSEFEPARYVVPFSAFAQVLYGAYHIGATGLTLTAQTRWQPVTSGVAAVASVALNLLLVPRLGYMGAAVATAISYTLLAVSTTAVGQRFYPVPWDVYRAGTAVGLGAALAAAALLGPDHAAWRLLCVAAYLPAAMALRVVRREDLNVARALIARG